MTKDTGGLTDQQLANEYKRRIEDSILRINETLSEAGKKGIVVILDICAENNTGRFKLKVISFSKEISLD